MVSRGRGTLRLRRGRLAAGAVVVAACVGLATVPSAGAAVAVRAGATPVVAARTVVPYRLAVLRYPDGQAFHPRWNPCHVITYRVNAALAGDASARAAAVSDVKGAVARLSAASGLRFRYLGSTGYYPSGSPRTWATHENADLVVAWANRTSHRSTLLGLDKGGSGGYYANEWRTGHDPWAAAVVRGFVVLDATESRSFRNGFGAGVTRGALLLHELGHAVGLMHSGERSQVMYPMILDRRSAAYGSGDRAGLAKVGRPAGCISVPTAWAAPR